MSSESWERERIISLDLALHRALKTERRNKKLRKSVQSALEVARIDVEVIVCVLLRDQKTLRYSENRGWVAGGGGRSG